MPHFVDTDYYDPQRYEREEIRSNLGIRPEEVVVGFIGTPIPHKGVEEIVKAMAIVKRKGRNVLFM